MMINDDNQARSGKLLLTLEKADGWSRGLREPGPVPASRD